MAKWPTDDEIDTFDTYWLSCLANAAGCFASWRDAQPKAAMKILKAAVHRAIERPAPATAPNTACHW